MSLALNIYGGNMKIYALYHGDNYIMQGTKQELADYIGVKVKTISFYMTPAWKKRTNYNGYIVIRVED